VLPNETDKETTLILEWNLNSCFNTLLSETTIAKKFYRFVSYEQTRTSSFFIHALWSFWWSI